MEKTQDKKRSFNLDKYIKINHANIVNARNCNINFEWDDRAVRAVYGLIYDTIKPLDLPHKHIDDLVQECATDFFTYIIYKFNPNLEFKISTYCETSWRRKIMKVLKNKSFVFNESVVKLDKEKSFVLDGRKETHLYSIVDEKTNYNREDKYEEDRYKKFLADLASKDSIVYRYYYEGMNLEKIAEENKKLGVLPTTHQGVSHYLRRMIEKIKEMAQNNEFAPERE